MPSKREETRCKNCKNFYCGNASKLPKGYYKFGTRYQCMTRGVGIGIYVVPKNKSREKKKERKRKIRNDEELTKGEIKEEHEEFMDKNFNKVYKKVNNTDKGQIFKQLAILWNAKNS